MTGVTRAMVIGNDALLRDAVTMAFALDATVPADAVKLAELAAAGTVTVAGTVRVALFEDKVTVVPPAGAALGNTFASCIFWKIWKIVNPKPMSDNDVRMIDMSVRSALMRVR